MSRGYNGRRVDIFWKILATLGLVALNGYFVAAEFAAVGARASRLETEAEQSFLARLALEVKKRLSLYLSTCQVGITIASLALGYITEPAVAALLEVPLEWLGFHAPIPGPLEVMTPAGQVVTATPTHSPPNVHHPLAILIALSISTALHVVVGEVAPKNWAVMYPDRILPLLAGPLVVITYILYPVIWVLNAASNGVLRLTGVTVTADDHGAVPHTEEELRALLAQAVAQGTIPKGQGRILTSAFEFSDLKVRQIMTPRTQVDYLRIGQPIAEVLRTIRKASFTRFPLCEDDLDHVIGLVHLKDIFNQLQLVPGKLRFADERTPDGMAVAIADGKPGSQVHVIGSADIDLPKIKRDILFVPELLAVPRLLRQFQASRVHMAVVVDEYGATQGIVTLEDVIEQLVGEIEDEFDPQSATDFVREGENYKVNGLYPLHALRERLNLPDFEPEGVDTIGGYIIQQLNRWPRAGDAVRLGGSDDGASDREEEANGAEPHPGGGGYVARVVSVQNRRVGQVLITPATQRVAQADGPGTAQPQREK